MTQILRIVRSLKAITADTPAIASLLSKLSHGTRISPKAERPFGLLEVEETDRVRNSSGVYLVTYEVTLSVFADNQVKTVGEILEKFDDYWGAIFGNRGLPALDAPRGDFIGIKLTGSQIGESEREDLGNDVLQGLLTWELKVSEKQPALEIE